MTIRTKSFFANLLFHFVVLGFGARLLFLPDLPDGHWFILLVMIFFMDPIIAYFFGWSMSLRGTVGEDAPKYQRLISLVIMVTGYIFIFLTWLGVIGHWYD
ncbi:hypothetical protein FEF65_07140 [Mariprofundus erugo]|uniref:Uncharacterized protein n=1 Tax=Mariprofundus erugo TaxID=2528639 RepID=A0A5R9GMB5_9PROT|nr:hypothetical protein [Mariprofundus erugo]TLS67210.1 hypothetical protein FEF65_07140 [Mariprofundus erugo]